MSSTAEKVLSDHDHGNRREDDGLEAADGQGDGVQWQGGAEAVVLDLETALLFSDQPELYKRDIQFHAYHLSRPQPQEHRQETEYQLEDL